MIQIPLLVHEKVNFYVWWSKFKEVNEMYRHRMRLINDGTISIGRTVRTTGKILYKYYNYRDLNNDENNVIGYYPITNLVNLSKYYYFSNGMRRFREVDYSYHFGKTYGFNR